MSCIVCLTPNARRQPGAGDFARFDCPRCGSFALSGTAESALEGLLAEVPLRRSLMSHTLRRMQLPNDKHIRIINSDDLPTFWNQGRLPTPLQQADNFILWIGDNQDTPSKWAVTTASVRCDGRHRGVRAIGRFPSLGLVAFPNGTEGIVPP
jgi:hypothetical protein